MRPRCEEASRKILPAIRASIANKLAKKGLSGRDIAQIMDITPAAVTYYLHKLRGKSQLESTIPEDKVNVFVERLIKGDLDEKEKVEEICKICKAVRIIAK